MGHFQIQWKYGIGEEAYGGQVCIKAGKAPVIAIYKVKATKRRGNSRRFVTGCPHLPDDVSCISEGSDIEPCPIELISDIPFTNYSYGSFVFSIKGLFKNEPKLAVI